MYLGANTQNEVFLNWLKLVQYDFSQPIAKSSLK
jgi:hypothetical protein